MRDNGVTSAVSESGPDGVTRVLPLDAWRKRLYGIGCGDDRDEELEAAAYDLLAWEEELEEEPTEPAPRPRRTVTGKPRRRKPNS
jgi:hypothetical protein